MSRWRASPDRFGQGKELGLTTLFRPVFLTLSIWKFPFPFKMPMFMGFV
jgi:hypothetical protein